MIGMTSAEFRSWPKLSSDERAHWRRWARQSETHVLTLDDPSYPPLLRETRDPPPVLFVRGNVDVLSLPQIAIVGSRRPTADGCANARAFAAGLSRAGYVITSGMALGIDTEAHRGTLACDGITIAVLGSGFNHLFPPKNQGLARKIAERGAVISEFLPDVVPQTFTFPQRNRVISGLAHGVLVVEAAEQSGSLITARLAGEQGREVFALPGSIHNPLARGCHRLIRQGVKLVERVDEILEEFPALVEWERERVNASTTGRALTKRQQHLLEHIAYDPVSVDVLLQRAGGDLPELYANLMKLELGGHIVNRAEGYVLSTSQGDAKMRHPDG
jgi:DNA processing protein